MADDNNELASLVSLLSRFERTSEYPETYLKPPSSLEKDTKATVKGIFDFCKKDEPNSSRSLANTCPLQELLVDDFDIEQIWQEIELQNTPLLHLGKKDIHIIKQDGEKISLCLAHSRSKDLVEGNQHVDMESETIGDNINGFLEHGNESDSDDYSSGKKSGLENSDEETDNNYDKDTNDQREVNTTIKQKRKQKLSAKKSQVDDKFFKLSDMLQFLDKEDRKFERAHKQKNQTENDDEDDSDENESELVDYFVDIGGSDVEDEEDDDWDKALDATERLLGRKRKITKKDKQNRKTAREIKYADFFDPPDGETLEKAGSDLNDFEEEDEAGEEMESEDDEENEEKHQDSSDENEVEDDDDDDDDDDEDDEKSKVFSKFEKKQEKLKQKIEKLEKANLAEKPWQMSGEAGGKVRPINSLLEEDISFDHTTVTAPDITEETTQNLEEIVKQRIKDEAWDDVERKVKPVAEPFEYKKKIPLDQEKSKLSLSQIYEQEYLKQTQEEAEEKENEEHAEIKVLMSKLFTKLDALSNFHFTPKPPKPELKVVSNVPVISVEEVAPLSVSDAMMLAPEEVHEKKNEQKGKTELTDTDRKRERRTKKRRQHERAVEKTKRRKLVEKLNPGLGNKYSKKAALEKLEKEHKNSKNLSVLKDDGNDKPVKSSTTFFSRLQDEVRGQVKAKKQVKKKKEKSSVKVAQLKL